MSDSSALLEELHVRMLAEWGEVRGIRERLRARTLPRSALRASAAALLPNVLEVVPCAAGYARPVLQARLIELALDQLTGETLAPPLQLPLSSRRLPALPVHALIFTAFPHISGELYPLLVDGYVAGGRPVVGVHEDWLAGRSFRRAILLDEETLELLETDVCAAPEIASAQVLALNLREEGVAHRRIADRLHIPLWNPAEGAEKLDDKRWTGVCWQRAGLPTPRFLSLSPGLSDEHILALLSDGSAPRWLGRPGHERSSPDRVGCDIHGRDRFDLLKTSARAFWGRILKPVDGTEGRGVRRLPADAGDALAVIRQQVTSGDWLLMEEHGTVRYAASSGPVPCVLRLNVCWNGDAAIAESSYAQVAASPTGIASVGQGGRLISTTELWSSLCDAQGAPIQPQPADWQRIVALSQQGVQALAQASGALMPALTGVDLLLDIAGDGSLEPVLLEANARPAGMGHCRFMTPDGPGEEPGVTARLWRRVFFGQD